MAQSERETLVARLGRYPVARYPVQHATTQFHLGTTLLAAGDATAASGALATARDLFGRVGMRLEWAKATNMLGVARREAGRLAEASEAFAEAAGTFADLAQPVEEAAASYNLGLVRRAAGDLTGASGAWVRARELFLAAGLSTQAAAAARDHGAALLGSGNVASALPLLLEAAELAERGGDAPGFGAAGNALGLAHLTAGDPSAALGAFRRALGALPRSLRPAEHAMVKANLALAHERAGDPAAARLAARQALAVRGAAPVVRAQAQQLLARLSADSPADLLTVLDSEPAARWPAVVREEVLRWCDLPAAERVSAVTEFVGGLLTRPGTAYDLAASVLSVLLELPPQAYDEIVTALVDGSDHRPEPERERVRSVVRSAMARFPVPQWQRLAATFDAAAARAGQPPGWS